MSPANDNRGGAPELAGLVEGGVHHAAKATFAPGPASCGSFQKVSATQNGAFPTPLRQAQGERSARAADLAGRYVSVSQLATRPALRLVDRDA
jgi:hypothetical protein